MSSAEHLIENLILGMKDGKDPNEIVLYHCNQRNLDDCEMSADEAIRIACHVVYTLYDGVFPSGVPQSNADRFRSMTDEELAKYFAWLVDDEFPPCCEWEMYGDTIQINAWLEWLEDEVKT